jgi:hypothetical protein
MLPVMILLRRVIVAGALLLVVLSGPLIVAPGALLEGPLGQAALPDEVWARLFGAAGIALALVHVLVLRKLEDLWWWCWVFVIFDALVAPIAILHAATGLPEGAASWPWWLFGASTTLFAALFLGGIAKAGQEKPIV